MFIDSEVLSFFIDVRDISQKRQYISSFFVPIQSVAFNFRSHPFEYYEDVQFLTQVLAKWNLEIYHFFLVWLCHVWYF